MLVQKDWFCIWPNTKLQSCNFVYSKSLVLSQLWVVGEPVTAQGAICCQRASVICALWTPFTGLWCHFFHIQHGFGSRTKASQLIFRDEWPVLLHSGWNKICCFDLVTPLSTIEHRAGGKSEDKNIRGEGKEGKVKGDEEKNLNYQASRSILLNIFGGKLVRKMSLLWLFFFLLLLLGRLQKLYNDGYCNTSYSFL